MMRHWLVVFVLLAGAAFAVEPDEMLDDPALETRAREIGKEVRCLVCRSESIEDSNAQLARDLRLVIRERLVAGDSDTEVFRFLTDRFGDYVRMRPRFGGATLWLWLAGPILLAFGAVIALSVLRQNRASAAVPLSDDEKKRLDSLLDRD